MTNHLMRRLETDAISIENAICFRFQKAMEGISYVKKRQMDMSMKRSF